MQEFKADRDRPVRKFNFFLTQNNSNVDREKVLITYMLTLLETSYEE